MTALLTPVALHDPQCPQHPSRPRTRARCLGKHWCIEDVEKYAQASLNRSRRVYSPEEREELLAESIRICVELASKFDPHRNGYDKAGRLCGYITKFLPLKAEDAYHRLHPEHRLVTHEDGKRRYEYGEKAVSLDALTADDPDRQPMLADRPATSDVRMKVAAAIDERWARKREVILNVADLLSEGASYSDAGHMLGLTSGQVQEAVGEIMLVADRLRSEDS